MLDIYYPPTMCPDTPILIFSYGSGFYMGARMLPAAADIIYHNLGSFFTTHRFITIVPDYRIVDLGVQFPGVAQDVQDAMQWIVDNLPFPDSSIYVLGHSAGAMNIITVLALPELYSPTLHPHIKGTILLSGCYMFEDMPADMKDSVRLYYGKDDEAKKRVPPVLVDLVSVVTVWLLLGIGERDIPCLHPAVEKFGGALKAKGMSYDDFVTKGHNHVQQKRLSSCHVR